MATVRKKTNICIFRTVCAKSQRATKLWAKSPMLATPVVGFLHVFICKVTSMATYTRFSLILRVLGYLYDYVC